MFLQQNWRNYQHMLKWHQVSSPLNNAKSSHFVWNRAFEVFAFKCPSEHYKIRIVWTMRPRTASTCCLLAIAFLHSWCNHKGVNGAEPTSSGSLVQLSLWIASVLFVHIIVSLLVNCLQYFRWLCLFILSHLSFPRDDLRVKVVFYHLLFFPP